MTSTPVPATTGATGRGTGLLEVQLANYQRQLADWKSCPSGKTSEGKAKIAAISDQIAEVKHTLATDALDRPARTSSPSSSPTPGAPSSHLIDDYV